MSKGKGETRVYGGKRVAYCAEVIVMFCVMAVCIIFLDFGRFEVRDPHGYLLPEYARIILTIRVVTVISLLIGLCLGSIRRTSVGFCIGAAVLFAYFLGLAGAENWMEAKAASLPDEAQNRLIFELSRPDDRDAELWVNGVKLGTLPVETSYDEFLASVPYWGKTSQPARRAFDETDPDTHLPEPTYTALSSRMDYRRRWAVFRLPERLWRPRRLPRTRQTSGQSPPALQQPKPKSQRYYAQIRIGQEWAFNDHGYHGGSGQLGVFSKGTSVCFRMTCLERQKLAEQMLDRARLNNYQVEPAWFEVMETCRTDGWLALRGAMEKEPQFETAWDAWAVWKYELDKVQSPEAAWHTFRRIMSEAERNSSYLSANVQGRAVELLTPKLAPGDLVAAALPQTKLLGRYLGYYWWEMNDRVQFGVTDNGYGPYLGDDAYICRAGRGLEEARRVAIAHALWALDGLYNTGKIVGPNLVRTKVIPSLLTWNHRNAPLLKVMGYFSTPLMHQFLLGQKWDLSAEEMSYEQNLPVPDMDYREVNGWLYLLASLPDELGRKTRQTEAERILDMYDDIFWHPDMRILREHNLLFLDPMNEGSRLAVQYWLRFRTHVVDERSHDPLDNLFAYLVKIEPHATIEMYVQAWQEFMDDLDYDFPEEGLRCLVESDVPPQKRKKIYEALTQALEADPTGVRGYRPRTHAALLNRLELAVKPWTEQERAQEIFEDLQAGKGKFNPDTIALWLEHTRPDHPLVSMLARSGRPDLRKMALPALRAHPTPRNQALLSSLLQDSDVEVRKSAHSVKEDLDRLAQMPLKELTSIGW